MHIQIKLGDLEIASLGGLILMKQINTNDIIFYNIPIIVLFKRSAPHF